MDRDQFVARFKAKLDEWNEDIDQLEGRAQKAGAKLRQESRDRLNNVRQKHDAVNHGFRELRESIGEAWHDVREGLEEAGEDLRAAIADARNRFRHDETE